MSEDWMEDYLRDKRRVLRTEDVLAIPAPPPLFCNIIPERVLCLISAEPYCGKSFLCLEAASALSLGRPFLDLFPPRERGRTLFVGQDSTNWDYAAQLRKLTSTGPRPEIDFLLSQGLDLFDSNRTLQLLCDWHEASPYRLLVLDTLASLHSGDENSTREMTYIMSLLKDLRDRLGVTIFFTTHVKKPQSGEDLSANYRVRGNTAIAGSIDFHLSLSRMSETRVKITFPKGRGAMPDTRTMFFDMIESPGGTIALKGGKFQK